MTLFEIAEELKKCRYHDEVGPLENHPAFQGLVALAEKEVVAKKQKEEAVKKQKEEAAKVVAAAKPAPAKPEVAKA